MRARGISKSQLQRNAAAALEGVSAAPRPLTRQVRYLRAGYLGCDERSRLVQLQSVQVRRGRHQGAQRLRHALAWRLRRVQRDAAHAVTTGGHDRWRWCWCCCRWPRRVWPRGGEPRSGSSSSSRLRGRRGGCSCRWGRRRRRRRARSEQRREECLHGLAGGVGHPGPLAAAAIGGLAHGVDSSAG